MIAASFSGCSLSDVASGIDNAVKAFPGFGGRSVEIITEEIVTVEPAAVPTDSSALFCYRELSDKQKKIYRTVLTAAREMTEGFFSVGKPYDNIKSDIAMAYKAVCDDNPEIFWLPYTYLINDGSAAHDQISIAFSYSGVNNSCSYLIDPDDREKMVRKLDLAVKGLVDSAAGLSMFEAECVFHDALCERVEYVSGEPKSMVYTSYGALVNGKAVCEGYSRAMQLLCRKLGIPCTLISGESRGEGHLWNLINPGDGWYHLDVTWDDNAEGAPYYLYFNLNDSEIREDHTISPLFPKTVDISSENNNYNLLAPKCSQTQYNYFRYKYLMLDNGYASSAAGAINSAAKRGQTALTLRCASPEILKKFENDYNSCVAEIQKKLGAVSSAVITDISIVKDTVTFYWS